MISLKIFNIGLYSDSFIQISFQLGKMIETTKLYGLISVWMTLIFIQGHREIKIVGVHIIANWSVDFDEM